MNGTEARARAAAIDPDALAGMLKNHPLADYARRDAGFLVWLHNVDRLLSRRVGLGLLDLADAYRDMYDDGVDHREAAREALEHDDTFSDAAELL